MATTLIDPDALAANAPQLLHSNPGAQVLQAGLGQLASVFTSRRLAAFCVRGTGAREQANGAGAGEKLFRAVARCSWLKVLVIFNQHRTGEPAPAFSAANQRARMRVCYR